MFRKILRIVLTIITFPLWLFVLSGTFSLLGIAPCIGILSGVGNTIMYFIGDEENRERYLQELKEGFMLGFAFMYAPFMVMWKFIKTGKFDTENF